MQHVIGKGPISWILNMVNGARYTHDASAVQPPAFHESMLYGETLVELLPPTTPGAVECEGIARACVRMDGSLEVRATSFDNDVTEERLKDAGWIKDPVPAPAAAV